MCDSVSTEPELGQLAPGAQIWQHHDRVGGAVAQPAVWSWGWSGGVEGEVRVRMEGWSEVRDDERERKTARELTGNIWFISIKCLEEPVLSLGGDASRNSLTMTSLCW